MALEPRPRIGRGMKTIALVLALALGMSACSSGPSVPRQRTDERLPDSVRDTSTIRTDMPGERQFGVVMLVLLSLAAAGGIAYLNYELWTD